MDESGFASRQRSLFLGVVVLGLFGVLLFRLTDLQFLQYDAFRSKAERNSIRQIAKDPLRGLIFDRNGELVVDNNPSYTLTITPFEFQWSSLPTLVRFFGVDSNLVRYRLTRAGINGFEPVKIARELTFHQLSLLEEYRTALPGVNYVIESRRNYKMKPHISHLLGYTKEISPKLLKQLGEYYRPGDIVGFNGIEAYYEPVLRGSKGYGYYTVDATGRVVESFDHGRSDISAREGSDIFLSIDMDLQHYAERLMRGRRGAIVAMDPRNGEVLAFVSAPDYNLADLSGRITPEVWSSLVDNPDMPMYNRASMAAYPPGSTFKMLVAIAALQEGIISTETRIHCPGSYTLAGKDFGCHGAHGDIGVVSAIEHSCNVFFYKLIFKLGFENLKKYGLMFHFGRRTGIDISNESPGILPTEEYYNERYGKRWNIGYLVNLGIGQGEVNTTPLQMAAYTAALANGGTYVVPHAVVKVRDRYSQETRQIPVKREQLPLSHDAISIIQRGMLRVVQGNGTGYAARVPGVRVAGKTGTAQNPPKRDHAWFVGYAPFESPTIAVAVIIENGGFGGAAAAPVAGAVMRRYLQGPPSGVPPSDEGTEPVEEALPVVRPSLPISD
ncbi:MAG TPA: penicillin-binding protein 2 [Bacteroidota bacterium]|nr:penicillin-binding protein 2 [Bacteroidota bacterium]